MGFKKGNEYRHTVVTNSAPLEWNGTYQCKNVDVKKKNGPGNELVLLTEE